MSKILIAEDEESLRHLLTRQLVRANHEVASVENGEEALLALTREPFDLVLSDMKMPRLDGMGLLREARKREIPVDFIVLTGHGSLEGAVEAFKNGNVVDYLLKPLEDIRILNRIVDKALEARQLKSENARLLKEMTQMALEDGLTGLLNHRGIHSCLEKLLAQGSTQEPLALVMLDMDHFKQLNDLYGHPFGDKVLRQIAQTLCAVAGKKAPLGRCGGDEFMMILPGRDAPQACAAVEAVRARLASEPIETPDGRKIALALCFGIADTSKTGPISARLVAAADVALYQSKRRGGNRVTTYQEHHPLDTTDPLQVLTSCLDTFTQEHSEEMTELAVELAQYLGLDEASCNAVKVAGLLHDIGKIAIPTKILMKPGALTDAEQAIARQHVLYSTQIIHALPDLALILSGVAHHHERWDGSGYPNGLADTEIPLIGRLLAVTDAYSAMVMQRPYHAPLTTKEALKEIVKNAGVQFDPMIAEAFVKMVQQQDSPFLSQHSALLSQQEQSAAEVTQLPRAA
ncbi:HD domain-containing phosphohydrolase [Armatimonas sp.]|uniref:bifunctional diguanylate cyclase/phosphohydrolase n=1 Tax=Armatimonas sp. TaxID=1872638 RepID=UPI003753135B